MTWLFKRRELPGKKEHYATAALALAAAITSFLYQVKTHKLMLVSRHDLEAVVMSVAIEGYADGLQRCIDKSQ